MHLSGGLNKPCIVVAGAREPVHFTRYPGHAYLATDGMLPCATKACWHCGIDACTNLVLKNEEKIPKCVDMIDPADLTRALNNYYIGGRLTRGIACEKPKLKKERGPINVVPTPIKPVEIIPVKPIEKEVNTYGLPWGKGALLKEDWDFMTEIIHNYSVKRVIEFGAGLSTLLFNDAVRNPGVQGWVTTLETSQAWIDKVHVLNKFPEILFWNGREIKD